MLDRRADARADGEIPRPHREAAQSEFLLSHAAGAQQCARGARGANGSRPITASLASIRRRRCRPATARRSMTAICDLVEETEAGGRELSFRAAGGAAACERVKAAGIGDRAPPPPSPKRAGWRSAASTRSSRRASRRAAIAACFSADDSPTQVGTFALVPQIVDAVKVPVIAAGGDHRCARHRGGLRAGCRRRCRSAPPICVCPEAKISAPHRAALHAARDDGTALTNLMTGRPARGIVNRLMREIGPISDVAPDFPARGRRAGAAARQGGGAGLGRFLAAVGGSGGFARTHTPGGRAHAQARRRRFGAPARDGQPVARIAFAQSGAVVPRNDKISGRSAGACPRGRWSRIRAAFGLAGDRARQGPA